MPAAAMPTSPSEDLPTPEQRLDANRKRLVSYMTQGHEPSPQQDDAPSNPSADPAAPRKNAALQTVVHTAKVWWRHHPAKLVLEIAEPVLNNYAKDKPYQLLGIAAAAGAAAVLVRPWRLVSITSILLATIKSSGLANVALSIVRSHPKQDRHMSKQTPD